MTIEDSVIELDHRRIVTRHRSTQSAQAAGQRRLLSSLLSLCAVLGTWAGCTPSEPEAAPGSTASAAQQVQTAYTSSAVSYEQPVSPFAAPSASHESTAVAVGNGLSLVVWMEYTDGTYPDILGVRIRASDGQRLDANPIVIATGNSAQYQPAVAFDGTNFLVVWEDVRGAPVIYGARVRASDGVVLDPSSLFISRTPMGPFLLPQQAPAVAFDGANYLVTWHGYFYAQGPVYSGVQAIRVRPSDGSCIESTSTLIARDAINSRVAYTDGTYLVSWTRDLKVEAARISPTTGQPVDSLVISLGTNPVNLRYSAVAARSGEFLVTWIGADNTLWARRVRASDGVKLDAADIAVGPAAQTAPEATFDGVDYRITWQGARDGVRKVLSTRVSSQGVVAADAELVLAALSSSTPGFRGGIAATAPGRYVATYTGYDAGVGKNRGQMRFVQEGPSNISSEIPVSIGLPTTAGDYGSAVAVGNGVYLVVWSEYGSEGGRSPDILGVRVRASDGARLDATPLRIGYATSVDLEPAVAFDGTNFLVVWEQIGGYPQIFGARVRASDGAVLDSTPFLISRTLTNGYPLPQFSPAVAFDGSNYLVTWNGNYYANGPVLEGVQAIRVRTDATVIDASSIILTSGGGGATRVAYSDGNYLVTWNRGQNVEAVRISAATGQVLDRPALTLATGGAHYAAVAAQSGEFLATWIGGDNALKALRVRASDGARLDAADIAVAPSAWTYPAVTFDGRDYRIAWMDSANSVRKVLSRRVSPQGEVAADAQILISYLDPSASGDRGGIVAVSPGLFLVSYTNYDSSVGKGRVKLRLVSDVLEPEPCTSGEPTLVLNSASPLTLECGAGPYQDPGAKAFDGCGNPIAVHAYNTGADSSGPGPNLSYEGSYSVSYAAWDAMGNTVSAIRTVNVEDRTAPVLKLIGPASMTHTCGSQWVDPGVTATDACYGNLSAQVWHTGEVNGWAVGTYTVTYSLTDSGGNSATPVTRTVQVANCPW
jgi:hypothetical protein